MVQDTMQWIVQLRPIFRAVDTQDRHMGADNYVLRNIRWYGDPQKDGDPKQVGAQHGKR